MKSGNKSNTTKIIRALAESSQHIFMDTFQHIIPRGDFYKKSKVEKFIWERVPETKFRYRMLHLLQLMPRKKSLHLAQKALNYRNIADVMKKFEAINVSPITISKRHNIKKLDSLYSYFE